MDVNPTSSIPDHSLLITDVNLSDFVGMLTENPKVQNIELEPCSYGKDYKVSNIPPDFMNNIHCKNEVTSFINSFSQENSSQMAINKLYDKFVKILNSEMKRTLTRIKHKSSGKAFKNNCPFSSQCLSNLFKVASKAERLYCKAKSGTAEKYDLHQDFKTKQKEFDNIFRTEKRKYLRQCEIDLESMVNMDGKQMWQKLETMGPKQVKNRIPEEVYVEGQRVLNLDLVLNKWKDDFASLYRGGSRGTSEFDKRFLKQVKLNLNTTCDLDLEDSLNAPIALSEVQAMAASLKQGKAVSVDKIPNEVLKNETSVKLLHALYTNCFSSGIIPDEWRKSLITPIFKGKGKDPKEPLSYRPVSLICNPCKGLSYILNKRLLGYLEGSGQLVEEQNGFRQDRSCQDHVFSLTTIIQNRLQAKKSTFCCFVDYTAVFDSVQRCLLLYALKQAGVSGKFLRITNALYTYTQSAVKVNSKITQWFYTQTGIRQGQNDSPTAFAVFINSLALKIKSLNLGVRMGTHHVSILLFADDIVLLAENEGSLQLMMEELSKWCLKWQMNINPDKTQIVHFRVKRTAKTKIEFHLGEHLISVVDQYRYLGCTLSQHLSHKATGDSLVGGSGRALGKIIAKHYQNKGLGYKTFTKLYQACVVPVMDYCSGIWGYGDNENLDRVHQRAIRAFLGLNRFAPIAGMEGDMGWLPLSSEETYICCVNGIEVSRWIPTDYLRSCILKWSQGKIHGLMIYKVYLLQ